MDPATLAVVIAAVIAVGLVLGAGSIAWWMFRKTLTLIKRLVILGAMTVVILAAVVAGVAFVVAQ